MEIIVLQTLLNSRPNSELLEVILPWKRGVKNTHTKREGSSYKNLEGKV